MKKSILGLLLSIAMVIMSGCGGSSDSSVPQLVDKEAGVQGIVSTLSGIPISGASVTIDDVTVTADANGLYKIVVQAPKERVVVNAKHVGYMINSKVVQVLADKFTTVDIKLGVAKAMKTFASNVGGIVEHDGAQVSFPVDGYVDQSGNPYTGNVMAKMSYYPITTFSGRDAFPGSFEGQEGENTFPIKSYGFMNVEITDTVGNELQLADGKSAQLRYPVDTNLDRPTMIPLWYYDTQKGYWIADGAALKTPSGYVGTVTHFTAWNLDAKGKVAAVSGCVEYENGTRVEGAYVGFDSLNWEGDRGPTPEDGTFSFINVLAEENLTLYANHIDADNNYYSGIYADILNLEENSDTVLSNCLILSIVEGTSHDITVTGSVVDYNDDPLPTANISILFGGVDVPVDSLVQNAGGAFVLNFEALDSTVYSVRESYGGYIPISKTLNINEVQNVYDIGMIKLEEIIIE